MLNFLISISHYALPAFAVAVIALCLIALLKRRPPSLGQARLVNSVNGDDYSLVSRETSIGRHKNCDIILNYPTVSRVAAIIVCSKQGWYITGIDDQAKARINGKKPQKKEFLTTGDRITLGGVTLIFENKQD